MKFEDFWSSFFYQMLRKMKWPVKEHFFLKKSFWSSDKNNIFCVRDHKFETQMKNLKNNYKIYEFNSHLFHKKKHFLKHFLNGYISHIIVWLLTVAMCLFCHRAFSVLQLCALENFQIGWTTCIYGQFVMNVHLLHMWG
jgi:ABC-type maltose transport system permease subunit